MRLPAYLFYGRIPAGLHLKRSTWVVGFAWAIAMATLMGLLPALGPPGLLALLLLGGLGIAWARVAEREPPSSPDTPPHRDPAQWRARHRRAHAGRRKRR